MPDFQILEVTIGLVLVYLVLALAATAINELLANMLSWRARGLRTGIENLLQDEALTRRFYEHPYTRSLYERRRLWGRRKWPAYLTADQFSRVLLDLVGTEADEGEAAPELPEDHPLRRILGLLGREAKKKGRELEAEVEAWFEAGMEPVSSWFKGRMQWVSVAVGLGIAVLANADTLQLATDLAADPELRRAVVERAEELSAADASAVPGGEAGASAEARLQALEGLGFTLGWRGDVPQGGLDWLAKVAGLLITGFAVSLGAPFWFDTLKKLTSVRSSKKPEGAK